MNKRRIKVNDIEISDDEEADVNIEKREEIRQKKLNTQGGSLGGGSTQIGGKLKVAAMNELQKYKEI